MSDRLALYQQLIDHYSESELKGLCFELHVDYESLPPGGRADKAHELILLLDRQCRLPELTAALANPRLGCGPATSPHSLARNLHQLPAPPADFTGRQQELQELKTAVEQNGVIISGLRGMGGMGGGRTLAEQMLAAPMNVNSQFNSDVVRPVVSGIDLVQSPRGKWTIDFGLMDQCEAALYEIPFEYLKTTVCPIRSKNRRAAYAAKWWQYAKARPGMRHALPGKARYIATPGVAKHRIFVRIKQGVLCNQQVLVFARADDYFFGILHSKAHEIWALRQGTSLEDRPRYTLTTTFETFSFPWPPGKEPKRDSRVKAIAQNAKELFEKRDAWLNPPDASEADLKKRTLTNLYNQRPTWPDIAHCQLDEAVFDAYG